MYNYHRRKVQKPGSLAFVFFWWCTCDVYKTCQNSSRLNAITWMNRKRKYDKYLTKTDIEDMESGSWFTTRKCFYVAFSSNDRCIDEKAWYLMSSHNLKSILVVAQFMYFWGIKLKLLARWLFKSWNMYLKSFLEFSFVSRLLY